MKWRSDNARFDDISLRAANKFWTLSILKEQLRYYSRGVFSGKSDLRVVSNQCYVRGQQNRLCLNDMTHIFGVGRVFEKVSQPVSARTLQLISERSSGRRFASLCRQSDRRPRRTRRRLKIITKKN